MTQVKRVNELNLGYYPHNLKKETIYSDDGVIKHKNSRRSNNIRQANKTYCYEFWNFYEIPDSRKKVGVSLICV